MRKLRIFLLAAALVTGLLAVACSDSYSDAVSGSGEGRLTVNVHDQAAPSISEAWVTFESVQAVTASGSFEDVQGVTLGVPVNLADLVNGTDATLASDSLPAGDYTGLLVAVSAVTLVLDNGSQVDPLNGAGGVVIRINVSFTVVEGQDTVVSIDFPLTAFQFNGSLWTFDATSITTD